jgi:hypothetical protein
MLGFEHFPSQVRGIEKNFLLNNLTITSGLVSCMHTQKPRPLGKSVRVGDISELSLFPSISMYLEYVHIANSNRLDLVAELVEHWAGGTFQFARCGCTLRPRLHYTGLHRSVAIFIPDSAAVYTTPQ